MRAIAVIRKGSRVSFGIAAAVRVHHRAGLLERGDVIFLDQGEMRDPALRLLHVLGDLAAEADDLDGLVLARLAPPERGDSAAIVEQIGVEIGVADPVAGGLHLREVDAEVAGAGADRGRGEESRRIGLRVEAFGLAG